MEPLEHAEHLPSMWIQYLHDERTPKNTIKSRESTFRSFPNAGAATREDVEEWWKSKADLKPATKSTMLSNLRAFYNWCSIWEHRTDDPTRRIKTPKVPNNLPRPISRADLKKVIDAAPPEIMRAVVLGAYAGLRVAECAALRWDQVNLEMNTIDVTDSKGGKSRRITASPILIDYLLPQEGLYVVSGRDKPVSAQSLQQRANRLLKAATGAPLTFHQLRHRYGSVAYQATGDLVAVGRMMGHASVVSTSIYAQANDDISAKIAMAVVQ